MQDHTDGADGNAAAGVPAVGVDGGTAQARYTRPDLELCTPLPLQQASEGTALALFVSLRRLIDPSAHKQSTVACGIESFPDRLLVIPGRGRDVHRDAAAATGIPCDGGRDV